MKRYLSLVVFLLLLLTLLPSCSLVIPSKPAASTEPTVQPTLAPTPVPTPEPPRDYGRDRTGEYIYIVDNLYHEADCTSIYGDLVGTKFEDAIENGVQPHEQCALLGKRITVDFMNNQGFERTMNVARKISIISNAGAQTQDMVFVTTGDPAFDLNNNDINYTCRYFHKEFNLDTSLMKVYVKEGTKEYHNYQCEKMVNVATKYYLFVDDAYEKKLTPCKVCLPPTEVYNTLPVIAEDDAHYYYVSTKFIKDVLKGDFFPPDSMNIDLERVNNGYFEKVLPEETIKPS